MTAKPVESDRLSDRELAQLYERHLAERSEAARAIQEAKKYHEMELERIRSEEARLHRRIHNASLILEPLRLELTRRLGAFPNHQFRAGGTLYRLNKDRLGFDRIEVPDGTPIRRIDRRLRKGPRRNDG